VAPTPVLVREVDREVSEGLRPGLIAVAERHLTRNELDVPDVRHIDDMGMYPDLSRDLWWEEHPASIGVWHHVPTNAFLDIDELETRSLRDLVEREFEATIESLEGEKVKAHLTESWIQFYRNGDYKVLHNHERYGSASLPHAWVGAYYIDDGEPDESMPYSGVLSFALGTTRYLIRPRAGLLVMWPAAVLHEVHPFYGQHDRVVVNFNIAARGGTC
jgi:Putative 2OG-Fe(II) oxygenase